jgi:hypothetical protein
MAGGRAHMGRLNVRTRNTAISARLTAAEGQYRRGAVLHPLVIPLRASSSIHGAKGLAAGTSSNVPVAGGGT